MYKKILFKGFTLIELLVVVAIIGILASVVLASLNNARTKGQDSNIKSNISGVRAHAEIYWEQNSLSYLNLCVDSTINLASSSVSEAGGSMSCASNGTLFRISSPLVNDASVYFCIDNNGYSGVVSTSPTGSSCI